MTREQILSVEDLPLVRVPVPEWGASAAVYVRTMNGTERDEFEALHVSAGQHVAGVRVRLVVCCCCDEAGKRLFTVEDMAALALKNSKALDRVYDEAAKLNLLRARDVEAAQEKS